MISRICKPSKSQSFFIFGPRGSGKSTFLNQFFDQNEVLKIDLLDPALENQLLQNPSQLLSMWQVEKKPWIMIDEIQKRPELLDLVHQSIENKNIKFALTGSSARKLKKNSANLLANRTAVFYMQPFSSVELGTQFDLMQALKFGLLPKYWNSSITLDDQDKIRSLYSYVNTYLKEEVAAEQLVRNLDPFRKFIHCAAQSDGQIINYSKIERDAGVSHSQAERHFEILIDTLIGSYLEPFETSIRKRQSKKSKFYFFDPGVVRALLNLSQEELVMRTSEFGNLFENFLTNEFFKLKNAFEKPWKFSYLRTKDGVEIDLIIEKPRGEIILIEIKSTDKIDLESANHIRRIKKDLKTEASYVLSNDPLAKEVEGVQFLHWSEGLKKIFNIDINNFDTVSM